MRAGRWFLLLAGLIIALGAGAVPNGVSAQNAAQRIFILNQDVFFNESEFGKRVLVEINTRSATLAAENRAIEEDLRRQEQALTDQRPELSAAEFRTLADEFDSNVEEIRAAQAKKSADLNAWLDAERVRFGEAAFPVLLDLATTLGAAAILDSRSAIIVSDQVDITLAAIVEVNDVIGDGTTPSEETPKQ